MLFLDNAVGFSARLYCGDKTVAHTVLGVITWHDRNAVGSFLLPGHIDIPSIDCTLVLRGARVLEICILETQAQPHDTMLVNFASSRLVQRCVGEFARMIRGDCGDHLDRRS